MKLSTRIKRDIAPNMIWGNDAPSDWTKRRICLMVDCGRNPEYATTETNLLSVADATHKALIESGVTLLPQESPVVNGEQIIYHYATGTYAEWCNGEIRK